MTTNVKSKVLALGAMSALAMLFALVPAPALAQDDRDSADAYSAGIDLGRTLDDTRACTGRGDYRQGCVDGVEERQLDQQADQALDSELSQTKPAEKAPLLSPPPDMFHDPFSKPGGPPN